MVWDQHLNVTKYALYSEVSKATDVFVRGWVGTANGFKYEAFNVLEPFLSRCHEQFQNSIDQLATNK